MRLIPGTKMTVLLDDDEHRFVLVAADGGDDGRLNIAAPLAELLGSMAPGETVPAWTPSVKGAIAMRVELMAVEVEVAQ